MDVVSKSLHKEEHVLVAAEISTMFYSEYIPLYLFAFVLLFIGYEYEIGVIGLVLFLRTLYLNILAIKEKASYHCVLTEKRLIIHKGHKNHQIFPIELDEIRTIYIKPISERFKNILDVGTLEVLTVSGGRYVIGHIKEPYVYHKAIIGDIVSATHYANKKKGGSCELDPSETTLS